MATVKNFGSVKLNDNQKRALCLGQGFVVSKPFQKMGINSIIKYVGACFFVMIAVILSFIHTGESQAAVLQ